MPALLPVPTVFPPLLQCALALCSLFVGSVILRTRAVPPPLSPLFQLGSALSQTLQRAGAGRRPAEPLPPARIRAYGWACIYTGTLILVISGGQLVRLLGVGAA